MFMDWWILCFWTEHKIQRKEWWNRLLSYSTQKKMRTFCRLEAYGGTAVKSKSEVAIPDQLKGSATHVTVH